MVRVGVACAWIVAEGQSAGSEMERRFPLPEKPVDTVLIKEEPIAEPNKTTKHRHR